MPNEWQTKKNLTVGKQSYSYFDLTELDKALQGKISRLPYSLQLLVENLLRHDDGDPAFREGVLALADWDPKSETNREILFTPSRVVLQDFTGVPAVIDLAVMRDACKNLGGNPKQINPQLPVELVIDHSVQVDVYANRDAFRLNVEREYQRNHERYAFLRWGQSAFDNFSAVPPGTGIVHQVNLEYLAKVAFTREDNQETLAYPDTLVGTDSHTTMINGLGVLGWGVGGIEAEAAMLGQPITLLIPQVVGFELKGKLPSGATATDLVLTVTQMLRQKGVVGKFVEFFGAGLKNMSVADRATISNMAPEYGATCGLFPVDEQTIDYLKFSHRPSQRIALVEAYYKAQGLFGSTHQADYSATLSLDLGDVTPSLAGPRRPQDRFALKDAKPNFEKEFRERAKLNERSDDAISVPIQMDGAKELKDGAVVIAAITSCTNTSNPSVMLAAGLVAKKAVELGLQRPAWVKTSLAPGSKVVTDYLQEAGLSEALDELGFNLVGYGCTTCIGNSGPLPEAIEKAIVDHDLIVCSVLSGNRNFEGRIHPHVRFSYLASPPLVVAYALAGRMDIDLDKEALGTSKAGKPVYLKDIWPSGKEIESAIQSAVKPEMFATRYAAVFDGDDQWRALPTPKGELYAWHDKSTYIKAPTFFDGMSKQPEAIKPIVGMKVLAMLGDSVTTDHISPAGAIPKDSPAAKYLMDHGVEPKDFNSYGSRRGNHEVMTRGTFGNIRLRNLLVPGTEGGYTLHPDTNQVTSIYEAAMAFANKQTPLIVLAGKEYGTGSSRDWAAKGTRLLGVQVVLAESFERIHRSNLIGMGVLPLQFSEGDSVESLGLTGKEQFDLPGLTDQLQPGDEIEVQARGNKQTRFKVQVRIDTTGELTYYRHGGILHYVLRRLSS